VVDLATLDGRKTGIGLHDDTHGGELREASPPLLRPLRTGRSMGEVERD